MLFCLSDSFHSLLRRLHKVDLRRVEIIDEGLHALNSKRVMALKRVAQLQSLELTLHAPFVDINIASPNASLRRVMLRRLEKSIIYAHQLGCRLWIFHPGLKSGVSQFYPGLDWRQNLDSIRTILEVSRKLNVEIAIENVPEPYPFLMKSVGDFLRFYNDLDQDIGFVLDIGHANLNRQIKDFITQLPDKTVHVHVSDNDGTYDSHLGIGHGIIDWEEVVNLFKKIKYRGVIMLESVEHVKESLKTLRNLFA